MVAFAVDPRAREFLTNSYSYRLFSNFRPHDNYRGDIARSTAPIHVLAGRADEVFVAQNYAAALAGTPQTVSVELIDGVGHMAIVSSAEALTRVVAVVVRR